VVIRAAEPLQLGDLLPEYHFTNQLGQAVSTKQFKGQALAITFIFTRCPLPNFCPQMSRNFEEVQKKLIERPNGASNWHLLTISFDPEFDTPTILKAYAERFNADPRHWEFLTGSVPEITALSQQFGQTFWREEGALNHNLRTVVIDAAGRVQNIITGNTWTSDELAEDIVKAAGAG
jgi:protein SCO1/2